VERQRKRPRSIKNVALIYAGNCLLSDALSRATPSAQNVDTSSQLLPVASDMDRLEREQYLVWAFDLLFGLEEFFTPRFAGTLGALVNHVPNSETVIAGSLGAAAGEFLASLAGLEELAFKCPVLVPQFVFTDDAHALLLPTQLLPFGAVLGRGSYQSVENDRITSTLSENHNDLRSSPAVSWNTVRL
jgi:hypothetical protein